MIPWVEYGVLIGLPTLGGLLTLVARAGACFQT